MATEVGLAAVIVIILFVAKPGPDFDIVGIGKDIRVIF